MLQCTGELRKMGVPKLKRCFESCATTCKTYSDEIEKPGEVTIFQGLPVKDVIGQCYNVKKYILYLETAPSQKSV